MQPNVLATRRLMLSRPEPSDIDRMTEYCQDPDIARFVPIPQPYTRESARMFIDELVPAWWAAESEFNWAIRLADGSFLGMLGARRLDVGSRDFELGFWLGAPHRGKGYVVEASRAALEWLAGAGDERITWKAVIGNDASRRVAEKLGFAFTGEAPSEGEFPGRGYPLCWTAELTDLVLDPPKVLP